MRLHACAAAAIVFWVFFQGVLPPAVFPKSQFSATNQTTPQHTSASATVSSHDMLGSGMLWPGCCLELVERDGENERGTSCRQ